MAERLNAAVLKTVNRAIGSWVQIPRPPPFMISLYMTRKNKASKTKVLFTILQIFVFVGVMLYADVFGNSSEEPISVNEAFLGEEDYRV